MEEWIGAVCKIQIVQRGKDLFYTAKITHVSDTHITFIDKYDEKYCYRIMDIVEIREIDDEK